jgi:hypothetical protein
MVEMASARFEGYAQTERERRFAHDDGRAGQKVGTAAMQVKFVINLFAA